MTGILTFHWADDYGALLQCYALKTYLNNYQETIIIPYYPETLRSRYRLSLSKRICKLYDKIVTKYKMNSFRKKYLLGKEKALGSDRDIYEFGNKTGIDTYVVGSDQVWNPEITDGIQEGYFCTFRQWSGEEKRYIAYAASLGAESLPDTYNDRLAELLLCFDSISLREKQAVPYIRQLCRKPITVVLDPVFLLDRKEWESLVRKKKTRKKYIAVYYTEYSTAMADYLKCLKERSRLDVLLLASSKSDKNKKRWTSGSKYVLGCGPLEFLELLYNAEYVVTNSFHGTAMSIMFQKQFVVFPHSTRGARILNLLDLCHLQRRLGHPGGQNDIDERIDWAHTEELLKGETEHSRNFVRKEILHGKSS